MPFGSFFDEFGFDAGRVVFYGGQGAMTGIYLFEDGVISRVADQSTPMPSSTRNFSQFSWPPSVDNGRVAFNGQSGTTVGVQPLRGVYMASGRRVIANSRHDDAHPGRGREFYEQLSVSRHRRGQDRICREVADATASI